VALVRRFDVSDEHIASIFRVCSETPFLLEVHGVIYQKTKSFTATAVKNTSKDSVFRFCFSSFRCTVETATSLNQGMHQQHHFPSRVKQFKGMLG
jgi:uncharacterized Fe-S cluster-containing radical SAM superfamily protein